jgi:hypothetical protein
LFCAYDDTWSCHLYACPSAAADDDDERDFIVTCMFRLPCSATSIHVRVMCRHPIHVRLLYLVSCTCRLHVRMCVDVLVFRPHRQLLISILLTILVSGTTYTST